MTHLVIPPGPGTPSGLVIPAHELTERFARASGPGGQGVNTTDSRVQLSLDIAVSAAFSDEQRLRLIDRLGRRLTGTILTVNAAEYRSQRANRLAARERLAGLIRDALARPRPRRATRRTRGSVQRRLEAKRHRAQTKARRRRPMD